MPKWYDDENGIPFIQVFDVSDDMRLKPVTKRKISELAAEQSVFIKKGTLIITLQGSIGRVAVTHYDAYIDRTLLLFQEFLRPIEKVFFAYTIQMLFEIERQKAPGGIIKTITKEALSSFVVKLPSLEEQQKIANCLSSIDDLITAQAQKTEALKAHKKGLMQQLFPREGETVPRLRFPEFRDAWTKCELENLIDLLSGYAFQSNCFSNNGNKLLIPRNFTKNGRANFSEENTKFTTEECDPKYICKEGDLLLLLTDLTPSCELLGKPILLKQKDGEVLLNQRIVRVIPKGKINIHFLLYFFSTDSFHKRIKDTATGSTVRHSSSKIVMSTEICFPSSGEQQKIANCLSSIDDLITTQAKKIESLKAHKKGLMQQLFPSSDKTGA